jgi:hypothetical protein
MALGSHSTVSDNLRWKNGTRTRNLSLLVHNVSNDITYHISYLREKNDVPRSVISARTITGLRGVSWLERSPMLRFPRRLHLGKPNFSTNGFWHHVPCRTNRHTNSVLMANSGEGNSLNIGIEPTRPSRHFIQCYMPGTSIAQASHEATIGILRPQVRLRMHSAPTHCKSCLHLHPRIIDASLRLWLHALGPASCSPSEPGRKRR